MIEIQIPEGVKAEVNGDKVIISGSLGKNTRKFNSNLLSVGISGGKITIDSIKEKKLQKKASTAENSFAKELQNDIKGVNNLYEINMKAIFAHFPVSLEVKGNEVHINNLFGERVPRIAYIVGSAKVDAKGQALTIKGTSLDEVTQTAANIRRACRAKDKDTRVFQDGVYYAEEEGR
ncbi:MAG: 50S ribosomal protein L6 [Candidatus Micrarchaeia archaeon]